MTLTIELPDETAKRAYAAAAAHGLDMNAFALAALVDAVDAEPETLLPLGDNEVLAAIVEGIADADAGCYMTLDAWRAQIDAEDAASQPFLTAA